MHMFAYNMKYKHTKLEKEEGINRQEIKKRYS